MTETIDRTTEYAKDVLDNKILTGKIVKGACQRHINDLEKVRDDEYLYYYDISAATEAMAFFEEILCLSSGQFEGKPFILFDWECFVIGSLFGWKRKSDDMRRFRVAYIEGAKGCGKSPIAAGIGLKGLCADKEARAEVYAAASKRDQAMILFRDAVAMFEQSDELQHRLTPSGIGEKCWNLAYLETGSFFRVISSEKKGQSGVRPHIVLLDEIHEHPDGTIIEMLRAGFKYRRQPLSFMITNSGTNNSSVCWEYHELGSKIALRELQNDEFFSYICSFDEEDLENNKYLHDESLWEKVNPSLKYGLPGYDYIRSQVKEASGLPSKMSTVKRLCFCVWTESENPWIDSDVWLNCKDDTFEDDSLKNRRCWGGLDLSSVRDLSAFALIFEPDEDDPLWRLKIWFWIPGKNLDNKIKSDHVPYDVWINKKYIFASDSETISKTQIIKFIDQKNKEYDIIGIAFDRDRIKDLLEFADREDIDYALGKWDKDKRIWNFDNNSGIRLMPFGQTARSMTPAIDKFETMLINKTIRHDGNPCLTWCASNVVVDSDDNEYRRMSKRKAVGRIDGITATVMPCGIIEDNQNYRSAYENLTADEIKERMVI